MYPIFELSLGKVRKDCSYQMCNKKLSFEEHTSQWAIEIAQNDKQLRPKEKRQGTICHYT
jgi:prophage antirepressor-like protein